MTALTTWLNDARLFEVLLPKNTRMLVEHVQGVEALLGMPVPDSATSLLPDPHLYPPAYLGQTQPTPACALFVGYRFEVLLLSDRADIDVRTWISQPVLLRMQTDQHGQPRIFHGYITEASNLSSNGGFARYQIVFEPLLAFLRHTRHSRVFIDRSIPDIIDSLCQPLRRHGQIDIEYSTDCYQQRWPIITQYRETDWQFIQRLIERAGLIGLWQHHDGADPQQAQHRLRLVRSNDPKLCDTQAEGDLRIHRNDATERQDSILRFQPSLARSVQLSKWHLFDPRLRRAYRAETQPDPRYPHLPHSRYHTSLPYSYHLDDQGLQDWANRWQDGQIQHAHLSQLHSRIRHLQPSQRYRIHGSPHWDPQRPIQILAIVHEGRNNLRADFAAALHRAFAHSIDPISLQPNNDRHGTGVLSRQQQHQHAASAEDFAASRCVEFYQNHALWIPADLPQRVPHVRSPNQPAWQPLPSIRGLQTAIVTGDQPIHSDRNHRIKIQFHWQRGQHNQQQHNDPNTDPHDHAPANSHSSLWVPVSSACTGDHMGSVFLPRQGQEVLIDFIEGDIDQPIVMGSLYNGQGRPEQQGSAIQPDRIHLQANSPVWFSQPKQGQANHLDGIKTQSITHSRTGQAQKSHQTDGYNQLVFDHHPDGYRIELYSSSAQSQLQLGQLQHQHDHQRREARGQGMSLETQAAGQIRGSAGLLLTAETSSSDHHLMGQAVMQTHASNALQQAAQIQQQLQQQAKTHQAVGVQIAAQDNNHSNHSQNTANQLSQDLQQSPWSAPHLVISAGQHTSLLTPSDLTVVSGGQLNSTAQQDLDIQGQQQLALMASESITQYAGAELSHIAAHGDLVVQAHQHQLRLDAKQSVQIGSRQSIVIQAPSHIRLMAGGSGIEIKDGVVTVTTTGKVQHKASQKVYGAGGGGASAKTQLTVGQLEACGKQASDKAKDGGAV
ncbi:MAG: type VI secretion system tip protein TssI/VgrG [Pseudomonadota bacterium]|nr:type VI secretion system tip protein TssI/VgrG [Pseudomonadota bacterium]